MKLTKGMLNEKDACNDGMRWFLKNFNGEAEIKDVIKKLIEEREESYLSWVNSKLLLSENINIEEFINDIIGVIIDNTSPENIEAFATSDENYAKIGNSGYNAQIGSSGDDAQIGSSGNYTQIGSSGNNAQIGSIGDDAQIGSSGKNSVIASAGIGGRAKAAEGGVIAMTWWDEESRRYRISVGYIGEDLEADTWYQLDKNGKFEKC